jgi:peptidyl-prolyl cis-trans isomerase SDCCAG10
MSEVYVREPPTKGKVVIHTSKGYMHMYVTLATHLGDLDVELWSQECPKTCRNFVQLCLEGYYNNTIFHKVIHDFIVQGSMKINISSSYC